MTASSLWTLAASSNFEAEQAERVAIFNKIAPVGNWKAPIDAVIQEADFADCNAAAVHFTGGALTISKRLVNGWLRVTSGGYYANIGA
jgi:hypothetical protein